MEEIAASRWMQENAQELNFPLGKNLTYHFLQQDMIWTNIDLVVTTWVTSHNSRRYCS